LGLQNLASSSKPGTGDGESPAVVNQNANFAVAVCNPDVVGAPSAAGEPAKDCVALLVGESTTGKNANRSVVATG
jgi:hypothetical protein